jgi:hypothetical protein
MNILQDADVMSGAAEENQTAISFTTLNVTTAAHKMLYCHPPQSTSCIEVVEVMLCLG